MVRRRRKSRRNKSSRGAVVLLTLLLAVLAMGATAYWLVRMPFGPGQETFVTIAPKASTARIGRQLEAAGVVRSQYAFDLVRLWKHGTLHPGEYRFSAPETVLEVYRRLVVGDIYAKTIVVPEGANVYDIAARFEQAGLGSRQDFLDAVREQTALIGDLDPSAKNLEGYLFPATYRFPRKAKAEQVVAAMVRRFRQEAEVLGLKNNVHHVVTVASLVERETAVSDDRPLIASVFENRLAKKMPLGTDPAVIYGLERESRWNGQLRSNELAYDTPYNTYKHAGLPPGPIANPGMSALRAAVHPAQTGYYYFVAAGLNAQGRSLFAATLEEHDRNVAGYRRAQKQAGLR